MSSWTIHKLVSLRDDECAATKAHIESIARKIAYGGSVKVEIHTLPMEVDVLSEEHTAVVRAGWSLGCPFIPTEQSWDQTVMNAMVDCRKGFISVDAPQPSYGMSPFRRAMRTNNTSTVISQERDADGFQHTVRQILTMGI